MQQDLAKSAQKVLTVLYAECDDNYVNNKFFEFLLKEVPNMDLNKSVAVSYMPLIRDCYELIKDFSNNKYSRVKREELGFIALLLLYITKPDYLFENDPALFKTIYTPQGQAYTLSILDHAIDGPIKLYREYVYVNGLFLKEKTYTATRVVNRAPYEQPEEKVVIKKEKKEEPEEEEQPKKKTGDWGFSDLTLNLSDKVVKKSDKPEVDGFDITSNF